jgi:hypothetical protein
MTDYRLGELKPAQVDYVNAFAQGYAAPDAMQKPGLENTLIQQKIAEENRLRAGGEEYQRTGDVNALAVAKPMEVAALREVQRKRDLESLKPAMQYGYMHKDALKDPTQYDSVRKSMVDLFGPTIAGYLPETYDPATTPQLIDNYANNFLKIWKLENPGVPMVNSKGEVIGIYPKGTIQQRQGPSPPKTEAQIEAEAAARARGTAAGKPDQLIYDRTYNMPIAKRPAGSIYAPESEKPIITAQQAREIARKGGTIPTGTRIAPDPTMGGITAGKVEEALREKSLGPSTMDLPVGHWGKVGGKFYENQNGTIVEVPKQPGT